MPEPRLIHLIEVAKSFPQGGASARIVLLPATISLPSDLRVGILAGRKTGKTTLLHVIAGAVPLDQGAVVTADVLSPVMNAGSLMHSQLSAAENLHFFARLYGFDTDALLSASAALAGSTLMLDQPLKTQDGAKRRDFEAATTFVMPFTCYLVDELGLLDKALVERCFALAASRRAGVVFTTSQPRLLAEHAEVAATLRNGSLQLFESPAGAIAAFESDPES